MTWAQGTLFAHSECEAEVVMGFIIPFSGVRQFASRVDCGSTEPSLLAWLATKRYESFAHERQRS